MITAKAYISYRLDSFSFLVLIFNFLLMLSFPINLVDFPLLFVMAECISNAKTTTIYIYMYRS